jgi:hypothetical protein
MSLRRRLATALAPSDRAAWRRRYGPYLAVGCAAVGLAYLLERADAAAYERYLGALPPALTVAGVGAAGLAALVALERRGFWEQPGRERLGRGLAIATVAAVPFALAAIAADSTLGFPRDTNVVGPTALLFYPSVALVAEVAFHLLPLAGLAWLSGWRGRPAEVDRGALALITVVAAIEPVAQLLLGSALPGFTLPHVFLFGFVQLLLLRWYGYLPMLWLRLAYYLLWHIVWGAARLELLF